MTASSPNPQHDRDHGPGHLMVAGFPAAGPLVRHAYHELHLAVHGTAEEKRALGRHDLLPRPWEPATCVAPDLRFELWQWLEQVAAWVNHEYSWDVSGLIPPCWPHHPHLVNELAVVADQRRRASLAMTSDALEEWHRYGLPPFLDRMRNRLRAHCEDDHAQWPGRARHSDYIGQEQRRSREDAFAGDVDELQERNDRLRARHARHLAARLTQEAEARQASSHGRPRSGDVDHDVDHDVDDVDQAHVGDVDDPDTANQHGRPTRQGPHLQLVDTTTGELHDLDAGEHVVDDEGPPA